MFDSPALATLRRFMLDLAAQANPTAQAQYAHLH
jgi:hypothetical protein